MHFRRTTVATVRRKRMSAQWVTITEPKGEGVEAWPRVGAVEVMRSGHILGI